MKKNQKDPVPPGRRQGGRRRGKCKVDDQPCNIPRTSSTAAAVGRRSTAPCGCTDWSGVVEDGFDADVLKTCAALMFLVADNGALWEVACWCPQQGEEEEEWVARFLVEISRWQVCWSRMKTSADACSQRWRGIYPPGFILIFKESIKQCSPYP